MKLMRPSKYIKSLMVLFSAGFANTHLIELVAAGIAGYSAWRGAREAKKGIDAGMAEQRAMQERISKLLADYRSLGTDAVGQFRNMLGMGEDGTYDPELAQRSLEQSPGFQFGLKTGQQAIESSAAAAGGLMSGATGKNLMRFGQDYGTQFRNQRLSELQAAIGIGQNAVAQEVGVQQGVGQALTQGQMARGNAAGAGIVGIGNAITSGVGNYLYNQRMDKFLLGSPQPMASAAKPMAQPSLPTGLQTQTMFEI